MHQRTIGHLEGIASTKAHRLAVAVEDGRTVESYEQLCEDKKNALALEEVPSLAEYEKFGGENAYFYLRAAVSECLLTVFIRATENIKKDSKQAFLPSSCDLGLPFDWIH